jgi:hypothetical protein
MEPAFEQFDMDLRRACSVEIDSASADVKAVTMRPVREATDDPAGTLGKTSVSSIDVAQVVHQQTIVSEFSKFLQSLFYFGCVG